MSTVQESNPLTSVRSSSDGFVPPAQPAPGFADALGERFLSLDPMTSTAVEVLQFKSEFCRASGFETALRTRIDQLSRVRHPSLSIVRGLTRPTPGDSLAMVSTHVTGRRLSEILVAAKGATFACELIQQVAPALASLHQQGHGISHGILNADRIIVTREGRLILIEPALGLAIEALRLSASRLRSEFKLAMPPGVDPALDPRSDMVQLGFTALALLVGRPLDPADYPARIPVLLDEFSNADRAASARLRPWLERALQISDRPFAHGREAFAVFQGTPVDFTTPPPREIPRGMTPVEVSSPSLANAATPALGLPLALTPSQPKPVPLFDQSVAEIEALRSPWPARLKMALRWAAGAATLAAGAWIVSLSGVFTTSSANTPPFETHPAPIAKPAPAVTPAAATSTPAPIVPAPNPAATRPDPTPRSAPGAVGADGNRVATVPPATTTAAAAVAPTATIPTPVATPEPPPPVKVGTLAIACPIELQVFEAGSLVGSSPSALTLAEGSHKLEFVNEALGFRITQTLTMKPGRTTPVTVTIPNGAVSINAVPWAEVLIDGKTIGETPIANFAVPIGTHEVLFRHPQFGEQKQTIVVRVDGMTRVSATLKR